MRNPYEVLNIREGASEEEIRAAYKKLVRKYHPDQYANNPLSDLAEEKLKEINEAYDYLMKNRGSSSQYNSNNGTNYNNTNYNDNNSGTNVYAQIRSYIEQGNLSQANQMLEGITVRGAEWNFLKGLLYLKQGWYDQARQYIQLAVNLEPGNMEYRSVLNNLSFRNNTYREYGNSRGYRGGASFCDICSCLICSDCLCECCGGDLISCI
ncbi:heat shock protein DnaJ domain protein [Gottschalkia purinilytica]|uniref:Heat shock protein DnaJ domain protein n=1 Tax=Gottschalkia purinilytica TaxID=1503 RepID=A0A0L0WES0_GOTPU|nr:DnaJ domain-containing protein [Gottschalkia purinilytica]KNF09967.1 heat shock protein DnaJ domain protein [Gottschalkia purinilytica]